MLIYKKSRALIYVMLLVIAGLVLTYALYSILRSKLLIEIIYFSRGEHGQIWVYEFQGERCLSFTSPRSGVAVRQSCISIKNPAKLIFDYQRAILSVLCLNQAPQKILMVGLGGGTLAGALQKLLPRATLDIVEINPTVLEVAEQYFFFTKSGNTNVVIDDGARFISNNKGQYDLIILDAFNHNYIPPAFLTIEMTKKIKEIMSAKGVLAVNTFSNSPSCALESSLYQQVFGNVFNLVGNNRIIMAQNGYVSSYEDIAAAAAHWDPYFKPYGVRAGELLEKFAQGSLSNEVVWRAK